MVIKKGRRLSVDVVNRQLTAETVLLALSTKKSRQNSRRKWGKKRKRKKGYCVCVCVFSSHSFWTSSSLDVPAGVTQEESHTRIFHPPFF